MYNLAAAPKSKETHGVCGGTVKERIYEFVTSRNDREALPMIRQQHGCLNKSGRSTTYKTHTNVEAGENPGARPRC